MRTLSFGKLALATIGASLVVVGVHIASVMALVTTPYTLAQVATHSTATDCWTVISGNVYNVTPLVSTHSGGRSTITTNCGKDGTSNYNGQHGGKASILTTMNNQYQIGVLVTPTVPAPPTGVTATAGNAQAVVNWVVPASDGNAAITRYTVTSSPGARTCTATGAAVTTCTVTGLTNLTSYTFTVTATNSVGTSAASAASSSVTPRATPLAPTAVTVTRGDTQLVIRWTAPTANGVTVTGYTATATPGARTCSSNSSATLTCTMTGLTNGQAYTVTVVSNSAGGASEPSVASTAVVPAGVPTAPTGVAGVRGDASVTVSWAASNENGDPITRYTVTSTPGSLTCTSTGLQCTVTGLTNGTAYTFKVVATNGVGNSAASAASTAVTPAVGPTAPTNVSATAGDGRATVSWTASNGNGSAVTGYTVTSTPDSLTCQTTTATTCSISGLTNGTDYTFIVIASNAVSQSKPSAPSNSVKPVGPPTAPTGVTPVRGDKEIAVSWTASSPNGSPITNYRATATPVGQPALPVRFCETLTTSCTVTGLTNGASYTVVVAATNAVATTSSTTSAAVTPAALPSVPSAVTAARGDRSSLVTWTASSPNGEPVTSYTVTSDPGAITCVSATNSCLVQGLLNGTSYTFTVTATNAVGTTAPSTPSAAVVPAAGPTQPTSVVAVPSNGAAVVSWLPSDPNGSPITGYTVTSAPDGYTCTTVGATSCTVSGLTNGTNYTFVVIATNAISSSAPSDPSAQCMPVSTPSAPTNVVVARGNKQLSLSWTAANPNGRTVVQYTVVVTPSVGLPFSLTTSSLGIVVDRLTNGDNYTFQVFASNSLGNGDYSKATAPVAPGAPPAPVVDVQGIARDGAIDLHWTTDLAGTNGANITNYVVYDANGTVMCTTTSTSCRVRNLVNGREYSFRVVTNSDLGPSEPSIESPLIVPAGLASRPTAATAERGDGEATISWIESDPNGSPVDYYVVQAMPGDLKCWTATTSCVIKGLNNGIAYTFIVTAKNGVGFSLDSLPTAPITPAGAPKKPFAVVAQRANESADVSWLRGFSNGSAVTEYRVTAYPGGNVCVSETPSCTVTGLTNGRQYMFIVTATNEVGESDFSAPSPQVTPATTASAATGLSVIRGDSSATISWIGVPDSLNGGAAISGYEVKSSPEGITCITESTQCTVSGLTNGVSYTFEVRTLNEVGSSTPAMTPSAVVPAGIPFAPTGVIAVVGNGQLTVSWDPANNNGTPITKYSVVSNPGNKPCVTEGTSCVVTGLTNKTLYTFTVVAENELGTSAPSAESAAMMPSDIPIPVKSIKAESKAPGKMLMSWASADGNGSLITKYEISWAAGKTGKFTSWKSVGMNRKWSSTSWKVGKPYLFKVRATNAVGAKVSKTFLFVPTK